MRLYAASCARGGGASLTPARLRSARAIDLIDLGHSRGGPDSLWLGRFLHGHGAHLTSLQCYVAGRSHAASLADTLAACTPRLSALKLVLTGGVPRIVYENGRASWTTLAPLASLPLQTLDLDWACVGEPCPLTRLTDLCLWLPHRRTEPSANVPPSVRRLTLVDVQSHDVDAWVNGLPELRSLVLAALTCPPRAGWPQGADAASAAAAAAGPVGTVAELDIIDVDDQARRGHGGGGRLPPCASRLPALRSLRVRGTATRRPGLGGGPLKRIHGDAFHLGASPGDGYGGLDDAACDTLTSLEFSNIPLRRLVWPQRALTSLRRLVLYRVGSPKGGFVLTALAAVAHTLQHLVIGMDTHAAPDARRFDVASALDCRLPALRVLVLDHARLWCADDTMLPPTVAAAEVIARAFAPELQSVHLHACEMIDGDCCCKEEEEEGSVLVCVEGLKAAAARVCETCRCPLYGEAPSTLASELCGGMWKKW